MELLVQIDANCPGEAYQPWDTVWNAEGGFGDWALAGPGDPVNPMGLAANAALETAVTLALFTDRQCPEGHPLAAYAGKDRRGYWGDAFLDANEQPLGSLLWLLERAAMLPNMLQYAQSFAQDALAPLVAAGAVARTTATASALPGGKGIALSVALYAQSGQQVFARAYDLFWRQLQTAPLAGQTFAPAA